MCLLIEAFEVWKENNAKNVSIVPSRRSLPGKLNIFHMPLTFVFYKCTFKFLFVAEESYKLIALSYPY